MNFFDDSNYYATEQRLRATLRRRPIKAEILFERPADLNLQNLLNLDRLIDIFKRQPKDRAAGVDGVKIKDFSVQDMRRTLEQISTQVRRNEFRPNEHRTVEIPRKGKSPRILNLPVVAERVIAVGIAMAFGDVFDRTDGEPRLHENLYGYRNNRSIHRLLYDTREYIETNDAWNLKSMDVRNAFPSTRADIVEEALHAFAVPDETIHFLMNLSFGPADAEKGLPQGLATSPTLFNILLSHLLGGSPEVSGESNTAIYADNCVIAAKDMGALEARATEIRQVMDSASLTIGDQSGPTDLTLNGIELFGFNLRRRENHLELEPPKGIQEMVRRTMQQKTTEANPAQAAALTGKGILNYYRPLGPQESEVLIQQIERSAHMAGIQLPARWHDQTHGGE